MIPQLAVERAMAELSTKTITQIQIETANTWGARAVAAYYLYRETRRQHWLLAAADYANEAVEHAALAAMSPGAGANVLAALLQDLADVRAAVGAVT
jgi:hypothetical protein